MLYRDLKEGEVCRRGAEFLPQIGVSRKTFLGNSYGNRVGNERKALAPGAGEEPSRSREQKPLPEGGEQVGLFGGWRVKGGKGGLEGLAGVSLHRTF